MKFLPVQLRHFLGWNVKPFFCSLVERVALRKALATNKPYFGQLLEANRHAGHSKRKAISEIAYREISRRNEESFRILEVGSWVGSSAVLWAHAIKCYNKQNGAVVCIDPWQSFLTSFHSGEVASRGSIYGEARTTVQQMERSLTKGGVFELFLHNIKSSGHADIVHVFKGTSDDLLPTLRDDGFDIVYIDGRHSYDQVLRDLNNAARLVAPGGLLCGIGLELRKDQVDNDHGWQHREKDFTVDPKTGEYYHPGITMAVAEFFRGPVSDVDKVWAMRKGNSSWDRVEYSQDG